ncbi:hypothetical protein [Deinococcus roseus]|uniref:Serine active site containing 1-like protein n=1 Tax=Deinococcus roseus TaxID=392414 RepID=A0ABQ2D7H1_9DEIO|nr:hypothetical protein [Deinococcus roseus]GGJ48809.1 hypothetical protein GCM10008938_38560 [Deinococcus roseus]
MQQTRDVTRPQPERKDILALWGGILFSALFTLLVWVLDFRLEPLRQTFLPDQGASWYFWKLPGPTFWTHFSAWFLYLAHQITIWGLIFYAQTRVKKYTAGLHPVNFWALGVNAVFVLLHLLQTHLFYDGLAQDVSIYSSQGSVIVLLVLVLVMENKRRGMFFGKKAPLKATIVDAVRKYHGYFFSWAVVYTFWYHPMETTSGHLLGTFYTLMLMLQGSLFLTRIHVNRYWTLAQELLVVIHGSIVALSNTNGLWPMFAFGFLGVFIVTQMHGLGWSRLTRWIVASLFSGWVIYVYSGRGWGKLNEIMRIPLIDYVLVFVLAGLVWLLVWIGQGIRKLQKS